MCMLCRRCWCEPWAQQNELSNDTHLWSRIFQFRPVTLSQLPPRSHNCEDSHSNVCSGNSSDFYRTRKEAVQSDKSLQWKLLSRLSIAGKALWKSVCLFISLFIFSFPLWMLVSWFWQRGSSGSSRSQALGEELQATQIYEQINK